ncbi:MAG: hypothetical protein QJR14_02970 [Bacillota bacterium]|nr:hypothetical protein [Bacillota bacterium]
MGDPLAGAAAQIMRANSPADAWEPVNIQEPFAGGQPFTSPARREITAEEVYREAEWVARSVVIIRPEEIQRILVAREELEALANALAEAYGWSPFEAKLFVLTGEAPDLPRARVVGMRGQRFIVEVDADVSPEELAGFWADIRHERRAPAMTAKSSELAVFIAQANDGRRWKAAMAEWTRLHPEWAAKRLPNFIRDARYAYRRVMGRDLEWRGGKEGDQQ